MPELLWYKSAVDPINDHNEEHAMKPIYKGIWRGLLVAICALMITACATTDNVADGAALSPGQGLLVMKVNANITARLSFQEFSKETGFGSRFAENMLGSKGVILVKDGEKYWVLPVDAGEYMWSKFEFGNRFANLHTSNRFRVKLNTITYIGDLNIYVSGSKFQIRAADDESAMRTYLQKNYPTYLNTMPFEKVIAQLRL
jgi:hypothetical protein